LVDISADFYIISQFCVISNAAVSGRPNALVTLTVWVDYAISVNCMGMTGL